MSQALFWSLIPLGLIIFNRIVGQNISALIHTDLLRIHCLRGNISRIAHFSAILAPHYPERRLKWSEWPIVWLFRFNREIIESDFFGPISNRSFLDLLERRLGANVMTASLGSVHRNFPGLLKIWRRIRLKLAHFQRLRVF